MKSNYLLTLGASIFGVANAVPTLEGRAATQTTVAIPAGTVVGAVVVAQSRRSSDC